MHVESSESHVRSLKVRLEIRETHVRRRKLHEKNIESETSHEFFNSMNTSLLSLAIVCQYS